MKIYEGSGAPSQNQREKVKGAEPPVQLDAATDLEKENDITASDIAIFLNAVLTNRRVA